MKWEGRDREVSSAYNFFFQKMKDVTKQEYSEHVDSLGTENKFVNNGFGAVRMIYHEVILKNYRVLIKLLML